MTSLTDDQIYNKLNNDLLPKLHDSDERTDQTKEEIKIEIDKLEKIWLQSHSCSCCLFDAVCFLCE